MSRQSSSNRPAVAKASRESAPATSTPVRNSAIPKAQPTSAPSSARTITHDMIAKKAYEISRSPQCGSEFENWIRAERELKGGR